MDNAPSHVGAVVAAALVDINCRVLFLPPRTTAQLQPMDVGVNGPFKCRCKSLWCGWLVTLGQYKPTAKEERVAMAERVANAFAHVTPQTVKNAFSRCGYLF
jgi:hypothetical protein